MKKLVLFILTFAIISIGCTAGLILWKNGSLKNVDHGQNQGIESNTNEKTLDLYGLYNENDIEIKEYKMIIADKDITYPQISGLKNKNIESKINNTIKSEVENQYRRLLGDNNIENLGFYYENYNRTCQLFQCFVYCL